MPTALVTGANGFIGAHLVKALVDRGYDVRGLVRSTSNLTLLRGIPCLQLFIGDLREPQTLIEPVRDVDYIFHLGARLMVASQEEFEETNVQGTVNLLETASQHASGTLKRLLLTSSQAAMGPNKDATAIDETVEPAPISWYGTSKVKAEKAVMSYGDRFPVTIVRPSAVYGEHEIEISQVFMAVNSHLLPAIAFPPDAAAVMVYVGDLVKGMIAAAESPNSAGQTYFLNHPQPASTKQVVNTIAQAIDKPRGLPLSTPPFMIRLVAPVAELIYHFTRSRPPLTRDKAKELTQPYWIANPDKARRDFGWVAEHDLLSGMRKTTQFYFQQQRDVQEMPLEDKRQLWMKYVAVGVVLGALIELVSALGQFYYFEPRWLVIVVIFGAFGLTLGTVGYLLRTRSMATQFVVGSILTLLAELGVALDLYPFRWIFSPGFPLGITNIYARSIVLSFAGGIFIIVLNLIMQSLYKRRLRLG